MCSKCAIAFAMLALVALCANASHIDPATALGYAELNSTNSVPPIVATATGSFLLAMPNAGGVFDYGVNVKNIVNLTMAHVHLGNSTTNGGLIVTLIPTKEDKAVEVGGLMQLEMPYSGTEMKTFASTFKSDDLLGAAKGLSAEEFVAFVKANALYVNIHTTEFPAGIIRGQIVVNMPTPSPSPSPSPSPVPIIPVPSPIIVPKPQRCVYAGQYRIIPTKSTCGSKSLAFYKSCSNTTVVLRTPTQVSSSPSRIHWTLKSTTEGVVATGGTIAAMKSCDNKHLAAPKGKAPKLGGNAWKWQVFFKGNDCNSVFIKSVNSGTFLGVDSRCTKVISTNTAETFKLKKVLLA